ncbi:MAG: Plug domain-containing protein, partial [Caulobacterales bacterium]|nr:Plug domain-containing protein [Caulobacterales bacterium]
MTMTLAKRGLLSASFAALSFTTAAHAQAQEDATEDADRDVIYVTALKRQTALADTPLAVTVLNGDKLDEAGIQTILDLQNIAPSVQLTSDVFGVNINIRGVTTTDQTSKGTQGIAFNVDGI